MAQFWTAPINKQQPAPTASDTSAACTAFTPQVHSFLMCIVAWTGAGTTASVAGGSQTWASAAVITNGNNHIQFFYVLDALANSTTITATLSGTSTNIQLFCAEYLVDTCLMSASITAASQSGSVTTYTCSVTGGISPLVGRSIVITGMADAGNNSGGSNPASFIIQSVSGGPPITSFTVQNPNGVTHASQTGTGKVSQDQGTTTVVLDAAQVSATGSSTSPASGTLTLAHGACLVFAYGDCGTVLAWSVDGSKTQRSTNNCRAGWADVINAGFGTNSQLPTPDPGGGTNRNFSQSETFTITSNPWEAGIISFYASSTGATTTAPAVIVTAVQGQLWAGNAQRFNNPTDPMGSASSGGVSKVGQIYPTGRA